MNPYRVPIEWLEEEWERQRLQLRAELGRTSKEYEPEDSRSTLSIYWSPFWYFRWPWE